MGFNVTRRSMLTAGHCTREVAFWNKEVGGALSGPSVAFNFPRDDFGLIRNDGGLNQPSEVGPHPGIQKITRAADSQVDQPICKTGRTTGRTCGVVIRKGATVRYRQGDVSELDVTNACAEPGDSGGPMYDGETALGLLSGGNNNVPCSHPDFESFFQPVVEALRSGGVRYRNCPNTFRLRSGLD